MGDFHVADEPRVDDIKGDIMYKWLIGRKQWGADISQYNAPIEDPPVPYIFVTYTGKNPCSNHEWCFFAMRKLQESHIHNRGCPDIRYNFCIGGNGYVYEGRGWNVRPTLPKKYSDFSCTALYIAYMGVFVDKMPGDVMHRALEELLIVGVKNGAIKNRFLQFRI